MPGIDPPLDTVSAQAERLRQALIEVSHISTELQDELRQLLSYCRASAGADPNPLVSQAYSDVAGKLAALLDGEDDTPPGPRYYWECNTCTFLAGSRNGSDVHETAHLGHEMMRIQETP